MVDYICACISNLMLLWYKESPLDDLLVPQNCVYLMVIAQCGTGRFNGHNGNLVSVAQLVLHLPDHGDLSTGAC